jgi:Zn ribbon nucleic-acid-binding protein
MTDDKTKCPHGARLEDWVLWRPEGGYSECVKCGQRFVPSDVLEEARQWVELAQALPGNPEFWEAIRATLARIDQVLGK